MIPVRVVLLTSIALCAFAANSVLCRLALRETSIDAATFTTVRIVSGALALWLIVVINGGARRPGGNWSSAFALLAYAIAFSFAYLALSAGTGALLLFGAAQLTMILAGLAAGERLRPRQLFGLALAFVGLLYLVLPGVTAPPLGGAGLMVVAGIAWGVYSLRGRGSTSPLAETAGNFVRASPGAVLLSLLMLASAELDGRGVAYAVLSGTLASGAGYAVWYAALPRMRTASAATAQLSVPVIAAVGGMLFLGEPFTLRLGIASVVTLGGIALVVTK